VGTTDPAELADDGQYGISHVCLSLPSVLDRGGVRTVLTPPMSETEIAALGRRGARGSPIPRPLV